MTSALGRPALRAAFEWCVVCEVEQRRLRLPRVLVVDVGNACQCLDPRRRGSADRRGALPPARAPEHAAEMRYRSVPGPRVFPPPLRPRRCRGTPRRSCSRVGTRRRRRPGAGLRVRAVGATRAMVDVEVKARAASGFNQCCQCAKQPTPRPAHRK